MRLEVIKFQRQEKMEQDFLVTLDKWSILETPENETDAQVPGSSD
jgi:hypothetical protein